MKNSCYIGLRSRTGNQRFPNQQTTAVGMGWRVLAALPSTRTAAIHLLAIGSMTIAHQSIALTVRAVKGDCYHEMLLILKTDWLSESTISCFFVPLPIFGLAALDLFYANLTSKAQIPAIYWIASLRVAF